MLVSQKKLLAALARKIQERHPEYSRTGKARYGQAPTGFEPRRGSLMPVHEQHASQKAVPATRQMMPSKHCNSPLHLPKRSFCSPNRKDSRSGCLRKSQYCSWQHQPAWNTRSLTPAIDLYKKWNYSQNWPLYKHNSVHDQSVLLLFQKLASRQEHCPSPPAWQHKTTEAVRADCWQMPQRHLPGLDRQLPW